MNQLLAWVSRHKVSMAYFLVAYLFVAVAPWIILGVVCFKVGLVSQALGYFLAPFIAGQLVFLRHLWLPAGVARAYEEALQKFTPRLLRDLMVVRSLILAALSFLSLVFHSLLRYLTSILPFYRIRLAEDSVRHQLLLVLDLSPRSPPASL